YHAHVRVAFLVPPEAFEAEPAVDSAVIVVERYPPADRLTVEERDWLRVRSERLTVEEERALWRLVQAPFRERRKMLHNVLARQMPFDAARIDAALAEAGIGPDRPHQHQAAGGRQRVTA